MTRFAVWALTCLLVTAGAKAEAQLHLASEVSPTRAGLHERFTVTITVSGQDADGAGRPSVVEPDGFTVHYVGSSTSIFNNSVMQSYTFLFVPERAGRFLIGEATLDWRGQRISAAGTPIEVTDGGSPGGAGSRSGPDAGRSTAVDAEGRDIFVEAFVDKEQPYVGEQVTLTFVVYNSRTLVGDSDYEPPSLTGFWSVPLPRVQGGTKTIDGRVYEYNAVKTALFPTTTGELTIGQGTFSFNLGGFFSRMRGARLTTDPITIRARSLPAAGRPDDFDGAVGRYEIQATADRATVAAGDVVTVEVSVTGTGNLDLVTGVVPPDLSNFRTYDPRVTKTLSNSGFTVGGVKTWEYVLMPSKPGKTVIGPFTLSFFDSETGRYLTVSSTPIELTVTPGTTSAGTGGVGSRNVERIAADIRYLKSDHDSMGSSHRRLYGSVPFYLFYLMPAAAFAGVFVFKRRRDILERDTGLKRRRTAWKHLQRAIGRAERLISDNGSSAEACRAIVDALTDYIGDCLNLAPGALTTASIEETLGRHGVPEDLAGRTTRTLAMCDFIRFSSVGADRSMQENILGETRGILRELREVL